MNIASQLPLFDWEESFDPDPLDVVTYELYLDTAESGDIIVYTDTISNFQIQEPLQDNTTYYRKVIATDLSGAATENTNGYRSFRVNTENDAPTISPINVIIIVEDNSVSIIINK